MHKALARKVIVVFNIAILISYIPSNNKFDISKIKKLKHLCNGAVCI